MYRALFQAAILSIFVILGAFPAYGADEIKQAPDFSLSSTGTERVSLSKHSGDLVLLDFWASWCSSCRKSFPWLNKIQEQYGAKGFKVIAINLDSNRKDADKMLEKLKVNFTVGFDPDGKVPDMYGVETMPTSFLIGRDGKVISIIEGFEEEAKADIQGLIEASL